VLVARKPLPVVQPLPERKIQQPKKAPRPSTSRRLVLRGGVIFALTLLLAFLAVARQAQIVSARRRVQDVQTSVARLELNIASLQLEVARLSGTARIEREAKARMHMELPTENQILKVGVGR
jgi:cell division protein FtsL